MVDLVMQKEAESSWIRYLRQRISQNKNFVACIEGQTGSGKSYSGLAICEMVDPNFTIDQVVFTGKELMDLITSGKLKSGSAILFEEVGIEMDSHKWQSLQNQILKYLFETFRHRNFIMFMTTPFHTYISKGSRMLIHAVFETIGINHEEKFVRLKPLLLQYNSRNDTTYWKYLRVITKEGVVPVKKWRIYKASTELIRSYEDKKTQFTNQLYIKLNSQITSLYKEKEKDVKRVALCDNCGYEWSPRSFKLSRCPKCSNNKVKYLEKEGNSLGNGGLEDKT